MKSLILHQRLLAILVVLFLFWGCKQPETTIVDRDPTTIAKEDTTEQDDKNGATFRQLLMGEYLPIHTLDPLYANNTASMRAVQLVYEGLVRLDEQGDVVAGLAQDWEVSDDSLQYTLKLRSEIYYHDNDIFSTGVGRKLVAQDVKYNFERMAKIGVPPLAAHLFMNIQGFEPYFQEQRLVFNPEERELDGISGIQTPDEQTVIFQLENQDPDFLKKLATPLAVIYPQEAVGQTVSDFTPVGSGPFTFSQKENESTFVFSKFQNYYNASDIRLNRIDIRINPSEPELFQAMGRNELYLLPQLGPQLMQNILTQNGNLLDTYTERYTLQRPGAHTNYVLRRNRNGDLSQEQAQALTNTFTSDTSSYFNKFPNGLVSAENPDTIETDVSISDLDSRLYSVFSDDPFVRTFLGGLSNLLSAEDISFQMSQIRAPSRNTELFFTHSYPLIPNKQWDDHESIFNFSVQQLVLQRSEIEGLTFNQYPWWFNIRNVTLPPEENLN